VKNNPMETAIIVAGAAVAVTGVGGPAGAAAIAAAVANVSAAGLQIASEAMPDNQALGVASTLADVATMFTPTGAAKKIAEETAEVVAEQALKHTDDIIDATKVVPNPAQVREEIAAAAAAGKPPLPGVGTPKAPNAPPAVKAPEAPATPLGERVPCAGQSFSPDTLVLLADGSKRPIAALQVGDRVWSTDPDTGRTSGQTVAAVLVNHDTDLLDLTLTNPADVTSVVHTTAKHPFYSPVRAQAQTTGSTITGLANTTTQAPADTAGWVDATDLRPGDQLATPFYDSVVHVAGHTQVAGTADMWDLTIETTHTFYIATPTANVLVHNCPTPPATPPGPETPSISASSPAADTAGVRPGNIPRSERVPPASASKRDAALEASAARNGGKPQCAYCGSTSATTHIDHVVPRAKGGTNEPHNLAPACMKTCNLPKSDKRPEDFLRDLDARGVTRSDADQKFLDEAIRIHQQRSSGTQQRLSSPADQRADQETRVQTVTDRQRQSAQESAQRTSEPNARQGSDSGSRIHDGSSSKKGKKKSHKKSKPNHPKPSGK
ncbi:polymorphic toxin-type HINT domain-containing protein, partial [Mycolicibacterium fluoranthenivorans]